MAQVKRAQGRKAGSTAAPQGLSTELEQDVEAAEEAAEVREAGVCGVTWACKCTVCVLAAHDSPCLHQQVQEEDGMKFTGFNLKEERETG